MNRKVVVLAIVALGVAGRIHAVEPDDEAIRLTIESSLAATHVLAEERVVVSFAKGRARLSGTVDTLYQKWKAEEVAARVRGVLTLDDRIEVARRPESESSLQTVVRRRFEDIPKIAAANLRVEVRNGTVLLEGTLPDARLRFDARDAAAQTPGVLGVVDRISTPATADDRLKKGVSALLGASSLQPIPGEIKIDVLGGVVHLEGWVPRLWERLDAERRILGINGVKEIINDLEVRPRKRLDADWR